MLGKSVCQKVVERNADGIVVVDRGGVVQFANPAAEQLFGLDLRGREFGFPVVTEEATEVDLVCNGSPPRVAELRAVNIQWKDDRPAFLISLRDVTERVRMEKELMRAKAAAEAGVQAKNGFLTNMSHELRTPLNAIIGFATLLKEMGEPDPDRASCVEEIINGGRDLLHLLGSVLDLVDAETDHHPRPLETLSLKLFLANRLSAFRDPARDKGVKLVLDLKECPTQLKVNEQLLGRVVDHLLANAIKFTPREGQVTLRAVAIPQGEPPAPGVEISVRDTGVGISRADLERIFEPFAQINGNGNGQRAGLGVGLSLVRKLVHHMGGRLRVTSSGADQGSAFHVLFPKGGRTP